MSIEKALQDIAKLKKNYDSLTALCGQIIATLWVNRSRNTLVTVAADGTQDNTQIDQFIAAWDKWFVALSKEEASPIQNKARGMSIGESKGDISCAHHDGAQSDKTCTCDEVELTKPPTETGLYWWLSSKRTRTKAAWLAVRVIKQHGLLSVNPVEGPQAGIYPTVDAWIELQGEGYWIRIPEPKIPVKIKLIKTGDWWNALAEDFGCSGFGPSENTALEGINISLRSTLKHSNFKLEIDEQSL